MSLVRKILTENAYGDNVLYHGSNAEFDQFDLSFCKSGNGLNKYGRGVYMTDSYDDARSYALDGSRTGYIYTVKAYNLKDYGHWEDVVEDNVIQLIIRKLTKIGKEREAEQIQTECYDDSYEPWSLKMMYDYLAAVITDEEMVNEWFMIGGIHGVVAREPAHTGLVYVGFDADNCRIQNCEPVER